VSAAAPICVEQRRGDESAPHREQVQRTDVRNGRAVAVHTAGGLTVGARRAVIADVSAPSLYCDLLPEPAVPARVRADPERFVRDTPVVKLDRALDGPVPWRAAAVAGAGTVHLGAGELGLVRRSVRPPGAARPGP
jgi:phytoene dehydrogenase-like protein